MKEDDLQDLMDAAKKALRRRGKVAGRRQRVTAQEDVLVPDSQESLCEQDVFPKQSLAYIASVFNDENMITEDLRAAVGTQTFKEMLKEIIQGERCVTFEQLKEFGYAQFELLDKLQPRFFKMRERIAYLRQTESEFALAHNKKTPEELKEVLGELKDRHHRESCKGLIFHKENPPKVNLGQRQASVVTKFDKIFGEKAANLSAYYLQKYGQFIRSNEDFITTCFAFAAFAYQNPKRDLNDFDDFMKGAKPQPGDTFVANVDKWNPAEYMKHN